MDPDPQSNPDPGPATRWRTGVEPTAEPLPTVPRDRPATVDGLLRSGLVIIDKPAGCTSHDVVDRIRRIVRHRKVGHAGTLDPAVTGVLPIGLGAATRVLRLLLEAGKTYDTHLRLHGDLPAEEIEAALHGLVGTITQLPPVRSRVKRVERDREIYDLAIHEIARRRVRFTVQCEKGTYIRKLCHDLGETLGCGGHMDALRRTAAGGYSESQSLSIEAFDEAVAEARAAGEGDTAAMDRLRGIVVPMESAVPPSWSRLWIDDGAVPRVRNGQTLFAPGLVACEAGMTAGEPCAILDREGRLIALAEAEMSAEEAVAAPRGEVAKPSRTFPAN